MSKFYGGCDAGSTYTKCVILDENGKIVADVTKRSRINPVLSAKDALDTAIGMVDGLNSAEELEYLIGTGYGRNKVPFADENISEISCHAMGVHVTDPSVKAIIDIGGQDVKGIAIDTDGTVLNFAMNDKCTAGTGRFFESMARAFEMSLDDFSKLSLSAKNVIPITAQCAVFAESEVISLVGEGKPMDEIAAGIELSVAKRCFVMAKKAGVDPECVFEAIKGGLAGSTVMNAKVPMMIEDNVEPGFRVDLHIKDLNNALECAHSVGAPVPMTAQVQEIMQYLHNNGDGSSDHSAIIHYYEKLADTKL